MRLLKFEGNFHGVRIYSSSVLKGGRAFTTGNAIFIGNCPVWHHPKQQYILQHEFGHYLQYKELGKWKFLLHIALPSFMSAIWNSASRHNKMHFEMDANRKAYQFFGKPDHWNFQENPIM